jgi:hypothetical protein
MPVLYVTSEIANTRVKNIIQRIFSKEEVTYYSHTFRVFVIYPKPPQISNCIDCFFDLDHLKIEILIGDVCILTNLHDPIFVFLNKAYDGLAVILWDVFCLVF